MLNPGDNIDMNNHPSATCPAWCVMGVNGTCAGEFEEPPEDAPKTEGWHVYQRRRLETDGTPAVELAIYKDATETEPESLFRKVFPLNPNAADIQ